MKNSRTRDQTGRVDKKPFRRKVRHFMHLFIGLRSYWGSIRKLDAPFEGSIEIYRRDMIGSLTAAIERWKPGRLSKTRRLEMRSYRRDVVESVRNVRRSCLQLPPLKTRKAYPAHRWWKYRDRSRDNIELPF